MPHAVAGACPAGGTNPGGATADDFANGPASADGGGGGAGDGSFSSGVGCGDAADLSCHDGDCAGGGSLAGGIG